MKKLQIIAVIFAVLAITYSFYSDYQEVTYSPRMPSSATGEIYPTRAGHNVLVYVTKKELYFVSKELPILRFAAYGLAFILVCCEPRIKAPAHKSFRRKIEMFVLLAAVTLFLAAAVLQIAI